MKSPYGEEMSMSEVFAEQEKELARLRRVEEYLNELLSTTGEGPGEWATNVAIKMREIKAALEEGV